MAYGIRSKKFLCCLPVRIGVFVLSLLQCLSYGLVAVLIGIVLSRNYGTLEPKERYTAIVIGAFSAIFAITSFLGFVGTIIRKRSFVGIFYSTICWLLGFSIGVGIVWMVVLFTVPKDKFVNRCIDGSTDQRRIDACNHISTVRIVTIVWIVINWIVHLYMCIIVKRYVEQLGEEQNAKYGMRSTSGAPGAGYKYNTVGSGAPRASAELLTQPQGKQYPYADNAHSFGSKV